MKLEYQRYGLTEFLKLTGTLQILGAMGLLVGSWSPPAGHFAAGGLALMMLLAVGVRIKIKDTRRQTLPAFAYMVLNTYLCYTAF